MCIHELIMGIHNSVVDIPLEGIFALGFSYQYVSVASQRKHDANNVIYVETMLNFIMTLLLRCVSGRWDRTTLPLRPRLHYIKHTVDWLYCSGCRFHLSSAYSHIAHMLHNHSFNFSGGVRNLGIA